MSTALQSLSLNQVNEAFLAAPPAIAQQISDLTVQFPNWMADVPEYAEWPVGEGTTIQQMIFRGSLPEVERGLDKWAKVGNNTGCEPCAGPDCTYNWSSFGGNAFERKVSELLYRDFRSPEYCVHEIQTTAHFQEVFTKVIENLYRQVAFFKEQNIGLNFLTMLAKKFVVDNGGAKYNPNNIYVYRNIGTAQLSNLNINLLEFFYEQLRRMPEAVPYDVINGAPIYALSCSHQLLARMYRDDQQLREDVRFSGLANDLVLKYNFMYTLRGMFFPAPVMYPRRFNIVNGEPVEVAPFQNNIPGEVGVYSYLNPQYEDATHEEVLIHGKHPFKLFTFPTQQTLGEGSSFGPEFSFMENWMWINPPTSCDPFRRTGYYATSARLAISQQFSEGIFAILVERPPRALMAQFNPVPVCPPETPACNNEVPTVTCPCPIVEHVWPDPISGNWFFKFTTQITGAPTDPVQFALDNGGFITGTLVAIEPTESLIAEITMPAAFTEGACAGIISVYCDVTTRCAANVICTNDCRSDQTDQVEITLDRYLIADTAADVITACFADGTTQDLEVVAVDAQNLIWTVQYAAGFGPTDDPTGAGQTVLNAGMVCDRGGIVKVCAPPETEAACPACDTSPTPCTGPQG
jgi:hypothetical protein